MSDTPPPRTSGNHPRIFLDGEDATAFLAQHRRLVDACEGSHLTIKNSVLPQLGSLQGQQRENDRKMTILIGDRVEIAHLGNRVARLERWGFARTAAMVLVAFAAAGFAAGCTYYLTHEERPPWVQSPTP